MAITTKEARKILNNNDLSDQEVESVLIKLYELCGRVVDKTIIEKHGRSQMFNILSSEFPETGFRG
ncbi:MAG: hypothetical protein Q7T59_05600 [Candidatus Woesebacteria bacterium]|nr:hypothetical protein [Candidatus Woesebacteria bacterium]